MSFLKNIQEIRDRARQQIENGAITKDYKLDREQAISILNEALATELVCVLRYKFHYFMATGIHSAAVAASSSNMPKKSRNTRTESPGAFGNSAASPRCIRL